MTSETSLMEKLTRLVQSHPNVLAIFLRRDDKDKNLHVGELPPTKSDVVERLEELLDREQF